jgi:ribosomal protein L22
MSAEDEKDVGGQTPPETRAQAKPAAAKEPAAKEPAAKEVAAKETAEKAPAAKGSAGKEPAAKEPAGKERAAKETAASEPAATKEPATAKPSARVEEPQGKPARRGRQGAKQAPRRRVVRAHARYVRTSARKARMVCGHLRGKSVQEARAILAFTPRDVARDWSKLLESAVANAESNHELLEDDLIVQEAYADEGPTIKRFQPRAMGRATPIRKRTSHLTITLTPGS